MAANENQSQQGQQGQGSSSGSGSSSSGSSSSGSSNRGFAAMDQDKAREIQSKGGKTVSQDREHMAQIGRIGGEHSHGGDNRSENR